MKKIDVIKAILQERFMQPPRNVSGKAFAPTNIALVKYWGKRNSELNLPETSSLSISLKDKGAFTVLSLSNEDEIILNGKTIDQDSSFAKRLVVFLNLFRSPTLFMKIELQVNIPIAAGLASSACGFASLVKALDDLFGWELTTKELSIFARLGSGSASRSIWQGFVEWHRGEKNDGSDSHGESINTIWPELCVGLLIMDANEKSISSRLAMQQTRETSQLYMAWPEKVSQDLIAMREAIHQKDFILLGETAEANALAMHATMLNANPPIIFSSEETFAARKQVQQLRRNGLAVYFTQDAGPNLKLLFLEKDKAILHEQFKMLEIVQPFQ